MQRQAKASWVLPGTGKPRLVASAARPVEVGPVTPSSEACQVRGWHDEVRLVGVWRVRSRNLASCSSQLCGVFWPGTSGPGLPWRVKPRHDMACQGMAWSESSWGGSGAFWLAQSPRVTARSAKTRCVRVEPGRGWSRSGSGLAWCVKVGLVTTGHAVARNLAPCGSRPLGVFWTISVTLRCDLLGPGMN